jgi:hypothetical protein
MNPSRNIGREPTHAAGGGTVRPIIRVAAILGVLVGVAAAAMPAAAAGRLTGLVRVASLDDLRELGPRTAVGLLVTEDGKRHPIAVPGRPGLLLSGHTRLPGLLTPEDVAGIQGGRPPRVAASADPVAELTVLERRIANRKVWGKPTARWLEVATIGVAVACAPAAVLGVAAFMTMNLLLGTFEVPPAVGFALLLAAALSGLALARVVRTPVAVGAVLAGVIAAHLLSLAIDESWVALSPLGPLQRARYYGISNLLETQLLVLVIGAVWLLLPWRTAAAAAVAALAFVTIAGTRFGADAGGAIVLVVALATLVALQRARVSLLLATAAAAAVVIAIDALTGATSHVTEAISGGAGGLADDFAHRVSLSWQRATVGTSTTIRMAIELGLIVAVVVRLIRLDAPLAARALPLAYAAGLAASLLVNDSPRDVVYAGLAGLIALDALALRDASTAVRLRRAAYAPRT